MTRVVPQRSNPKAKIYREYRDIQGRYAATFLTVPNEGQLMVLQFRFWTDVRPERSPEDFSKNGLEPTTC